MTLTPPPSVTSDTRTHGDGDATVRSVVCSMPRTPGARMIEAVAPLPTTFRLVPRPYQYEAVAALLAATARGIRRPLLVLPVSDCVETYQNGQDENGAFFWHQICCGPRL